MWVYPKWTLRILSHHSVWTELKLSALEENQRWSQDFPQGGGWECWVSSRVKCIGWMCWICRNCAANSLMCSLAQVGFNWRYWLHCHSNSRVSWMIIENLKWRIGGDIIPLTFGKFVTSYIQKLEILRDNKNCQSMYWLQCYKFSKVSRIISPPIHHSRFSIFALETHKFKMK